MLIDTLIGAWLPAYHPWARIKEVQHPKFYFFDSGVVRALGRRLREPLDAEERGRLFETLIFHELRAAISYASIGGELSYWRTPSGSEVDFIWTRGANAIAIEVKSGPRWRPSDGRVLKDLLESRTVQRCFAVYGGERALQDGPISVLPLDQFLQQLTRGSILRSSRMGPDRRRAELGL